MARVLLYRPLMLSMAVLVLLVPTILGAACGVTPPPDPTPEVGIYVGAERCCPVPLQQTCYLVCHASRRGP